MVQRQGKAVSSVNLVGKEQSRKAAQKVVYSYSTLGYDFFTSVYNSLNEAIE